MPYASAAAIRDRRSTIWSKLGEVSQDIKRGSDLGEEKIVFQKELNNINNINIDNFKEGLMWLQFSARKVKIEIKRCAAASPKSLGNHCLVEMI